MRPLLPHLPARSRSRVAVFGDQWRRTGLAALLVVLSTCSGVYPATTNAAAPAAFYVEATGHTLGHGFLQAWIELEGERTLGNPVSEPWPAADATLQYFQYGVLAQLPDGSVVREKAALALLELRSGDALPPDRELEVVTPPGVLTELRSIRSMTPAGSGFPYFVDSSIHDFYDAHEGRITFGRPLGPSTRTSEIIEQWFEFGRIELRSGGPIIAPIGLELAIARGVDTTSLPRGDLPPFDPGRYVDFHGDGTIPEATGVFIPARIMIPAIQVDAAIEPVGVVGGVMQVPVNEWNVGWYESMSSPGQWTNIVMAGHKDWWGVGPVVFWNLDDLVAGDRIYVVGADGSGATFEVTLSWLIDSTMPADPLIADTGYEALTLITCDGQWNGTEYTSRRIIRAKRI